MSNRQDKPKMSAADLVIKMRDEKGITFNLVSEAEAERYLSDINNYFRTASYRKNYQKYQRGANQGKYMDLDFGYLRELSSIDWKLRRCINDMCLDIEHDLKNRLLHDIEIDPNEDGYQIVEDFINQNPYLIGKLAPTTISTYTGELMRKYLTVTTTYNQARRRHETVITAYNDCPVWAFVEFITFGDFIRLYCGYYDKNNLPRMTTSILSAVKSLRNACAHNNCTLSNIEYGTTHAPVEITQLVMSVNGITPSQRRKRLSSRFLFEFTCLLYAYQQATASNDGHESLTDLLRVFLHRMTQNANYFQRNNLILGAYDFATKLLAHMFPDEYEQVQSEKKPVKRPAMQVIRSALKEIFS